MADINNELETKKQIEGEEETEGQDFDPSTLNSWVSEAITALGEKNPQPAAESRQKQLVNSKDAKCGIEIPSVKCKVEAPTTKCKVEAPTTKCKVEAPSTKCKVEAPSTKCKVEAPTMKCKVDVPEIKRRKA